MIYTEKLLSKNGLATLYLSKEFLKYTIGNKIPTVTDFCNQLSLSRGTVQNALRLLQSENAIAVEARGHLGSFLIKKDTLLLLKFAGINSLVGAMPLPYSRKYEGLATGLIVAMENKYNIPVSLAFMRGARTRIRMVLAKRYDFAVVSKYAANEFLIKNKGIRIIKDFGKGSYLSNHVVFFHDKKALTIEKGMKIGIDDDSIDQKDLTESLCKGIPVEYVHVGYNQILQSVISGAIDAAVWNKDEVTDKLIDINYVDIKLENEDNTTAVIVVNDEIVEMESLLHQVINEKTVLKIQQQVVQGKITPSY